jgi:uncharacterized Tic20 family protein
MVQTGEQGIPGDAAGEISSEEKLISLLCHLSLFFGGVILPFIMWLVYKDKTKFVRFHALQALWFQVSYIALLVVLVLIVAVIGILMGLITDSNSPHDDPSFLAVILIFLLYGGIMICIFGAYAYSVYVGVKAFQGELKKYVFLGNIIYNKVYGR